MLVLSRKPGEQLVIGTNIVLTLTEISGGRAKIGIQAPPEVIILRGELVDAPIVAVVQSKWAEPKPKSSRRQPLPREPFCNTHPVPAVSQCRD
jgi:carbon storage regulator